MLQNFRVFLVKVLIIILFWKKNRHFLMKYLCLSLGVITNDDFQEWISEDLEEKEDD